MNKNQEIDKDYYLATKDEKDDFLIYASDTFKLSEIDLINLIKICLIEVRSKSIGKKILAVYRDSNEYRRHIVQKKLKLIGISAEEDKNPLISKKSKIK